MQETSLVYVIVSVNFAAPLLSVKEKRKTQTFLFFLICKKIKQTSRPV